MGVMGRTLTAGRIFSVLLIPLLLAMSAGRDEAPPRPSRDGGDRSDLSRVIRLRFPAKRRKAAGGRGGQGGLSLHGSGAGRVEPGEDSPAQGTQGAAGRTSTKFAVLRGRVVDAIDGKPVQGAEVSVPELDLRAVSTSDGSFEIGSILVRKESYEVLVTCPGYESLFSDLVFDAPSVKEFQCRLKPLGW